MSRIYTEIFRLYKTKTNNLYILVDIYIIVINYSLTVNWFRANVTLDLILMTRNGDVDRRTER